MAVKKERLDVLLVEKGICTSRERAKTSIMAGLVYVDGQKVDKVGEKVSVEADIVYKGEKMPYVSRGGFKLEKAMKEFNIDLTDTVCMDIGASTGGFTDCMLQNNAKKVFQVLDHCTIFLLIAGSYTPFALCTFREYNTAVGWSLFGIIWGVAILGIVLNAIDLKKYKIFSMICYLAMGWCIIIKLPLLLQLVGIPGTVLLVSGGIAYTIGAVLYGVGKKHKYIHSIFHLFIVLASVLQFLSILLYVM